MTPKEGGRAQHSHALHGRKHKATGPLERGKGSTRPVQRACSKLKMQSPFKLTKVKCTLPLDVCTLKNGWGCQHFLPLVDTCTHQLPLERCSNWQQTSPSKHAMHSYAWVQVNKLIKLTRSYTCIDNMSRGHTSTRTLLEALRNISKQHESKQVLNFKKRKASPKSSI